MSNKYLLPCECGHKIEVVPIQAGSLIQCPACQKEFEAPSMLKIRQLEPVESTDQKSAAKKEWSFTQGLAFSVGAFILLASAAGAGYLFYKAEENNYVKPVITDELMETQYAMIDAAPGSQILEMWTEVMTKNEPGQWTEPEYLVRQRNSRQYFFGGSVVSGVGVLGLILIGLSFFGGRRK